MKLCKNCKFISKDHIIYPRCNRPDGYDLVSGELRRVDNYCCEERVVGWLQSRIKGTCGKEGRYFEDKGELH